MSLHVYRENIGSDRLVIRQLEEKDASGLAIFLNECEEGWPGGFTGGIPFTPERVLEDLKKEKALAYLVLNYNDKIIGICTIHEHWMHKNAGYIGFLNLHPEYHGKGLGRRLLMQGIRYGIDAGFERLDLGTWAGNMKAVPLYKKTGFYWIPGTRVHMQNYIPKILVFPIAKEFFQKYPDWYSNFKRSLKVEEDDMKEKSMNVFIYKWEKNGEKLKVLVDREAFSIAGLEDGDISVMCWPILHEAPAGYSQKVKWYIKNKQEKRIKGSLLVSCEEGIKISKKPQATFTLEPLQEVTLEGEVKIDQKIEKKDRNQPAHKINSKILIDGTLIPLTNGIRVHSPIDITFYPEYFSGYPGSKDILQITLKNNLNESIEGILSIVPHPMINVSSLNESFKISKEGYAGVTVKIEIPKDTGNLVIPLRLYTTIKKGNEEIQTKEQVLPIKSFTHGGVLASIEGEGKILSIENEVTRAVIGLHNGGRLHSFHSKISERHYANSLHDAIGPPFWPTETDRKDFKCQLFREEGRIRARLYTDLDTYPGLRIIKDVTLFPSTEIIKIQYSFINSSSTISHDFQLMMRTIINLDDARIIIPLKNGILSTIADGDFPHWEADLPKNPASLSETWFCIEYPDTGEVLGLLWHPENIVKNSFGRAEELFFKPKILEPQSTVFLQPMYLVGGFGKWSRIRELWRRFIKGRIRKKFQYRKTKQQPLIDAFFKPSIVDAPKEIESKIIIINRREKPLSGHITIKPPKSWSINPRRFKIKNVKLEKPYKGSITVSPKRNVDSGNYQGNINVTTNLTDFNIPFSILVLGQKGDVQVKKTNEEKKIFYVDNGKLILKICPNFAGTAYSLIEKKTRVNHLLSSFPNPKPYGYQNPWFGGMRFSAQKTAKYDKLHKEKFHCIKVRRCGWVGVKVYTEPLRHVKDLKGIDLETFYLTKPGSNLFARILHVNNRTSARMRFGVQQNTFVQVGGSIKDNTSFYKKGERVLRRRRIREMVWVIPDEGWLQVTNEQTEDSLIIVSTISERNRVILDDRGLLGINLGIRTDLNVDPYESIEILSYLILAKGSDIYKDYKKLSDFPELI